MTSRDIEQLMEDIRSGDTDMLVAACESLLISWRSVPVEELLSMKEQFRKLDMEHREAHLEELLISIAEKRPEPFTAIVTRPGHPLWRPALEVLSLLDRNDYLELFISLIPLCPKKDMPELVKAIGCFRCHRSSDALARLLSTDDDSVFLEAILALKRCGGPDVAGPLGEALEKKRREGSELASVVEAVMQEIGALPDSKAGKGC